ncbi:MAG: nucleotidyltransferase, partial [Blastocatellia bacterium]|nr:nucleotidyltransferase [Blastocatellia bacterium]
RVLLTGIHLMRSGEIEANLLNLNQEFKLPYLDDLIAYKLGGNEHSHLGSLKEAELEFHELEYERLRRRLEEASLSSALPERATGKAALNDLLIRLRLKPNRD